MWKKILVLGLIAFLTGRIWVILKLFGLHKPIYKHYPGPCRNIDILNQGSEDMERIPGDKILITTGLRFTERYVANRADRVGKVYMLDLNLPDDNPILVTINNYPGDMSQIDFHGLSVWVEPSGEVSVFIVNHAEEYSVVDIFTYNDNDNTLRYEETCGLGDTNFRRLNDVIATGRRQFYATNYLHMRGVAGTMEGWVQLGWGSVLYYDGHDSHVVITGLGMPNGINKSPDGRFIYVAHIVERSINVYERNSDQNLTLAQTWPLYSAGDNIIVDPDTGDLLVAGHPVGYAITKHAEDLKTLSPSQVLYTRVEKGLIVDMAEVFVDDGNLISGSSVAVYAKNKLLIGSVAAQTVICDVKFM